MNKLHQFFKTHYWLMIALLANLVLLLVWFASLTENELLVLFSSDALTQASVYYDIFVNGSTVQGWTFCGAPNFFPDMLFYSILMGITSNFLTSTFLFSLIQYFAIAFIIFAIFRQITNITSSVFSLSIYLFLFTLLYFLVDNGFYYSFLILSCSYHNGVFVISLLIAFLSLKFIEKESWITLVLIFLMTAIMYPCDRLFLITYLAPALFTVVVLLITGGNKRKILKFSSTCILGLLVGMIIFDKLSHNSVFYIYGIVQDISWPAIVNAWNVFSSQMIVTVSHFSFIGLTIILSAISYIWTAYYCVNQFIKIRQKKQPISSLFVFEVFVFAFVPMMLFAPILNGSYIGFDAIRYNYFAFIILQFNLILLSNGFLAKYKYVTYGLNGVFSIALIAYLAWNIFTIDFITDFKNYFSSYTERTRNVDNQFPQNKTAIYGITNDYWYAKHVTMFSKKEVRLYVTFEEGIPFLLATNKKWFTGNSDWKYTNPVFTFVLWTSDLPLPDYFITQNPPYKSYDIGGNKTLHFVNPFVYDEDVLYPRDKNELQTPECQIQ